MSVVPALPHIPLQTQIIQRFVVDACGGDLEVVLQMTEFFLSSAAQLVAEMENELTAGDLAVVRRAAHSLKSSGRMFSAEVLSALCAKAEELALAGSASDIEQLLPQVRNELEWLVVELPAICREMLT